jgi:uncharacterized membrane protein YccF (DUF307 family)
VTVLVEGIVLREGIFFVILFMFWLCASLCHYGMILLLGVIIIPMILKYGFYKKKLPASAQFRIDRSNEVLLGCRAAC